MRDRVVRRILIGAGLGFLILASVGYVTHLGPKAMPQAGFDYNQALARSWDEQLLLNLVRLRYRDTPVFLRTGSIVSRYSFGGSAGVSAGTNLSSAEDVQVGISGGISYREDPTVTYRGYWYFIDDSDLHSKSTIILLSYLFALKAWSEPGRGPLQKQGPDLEERLRVRGYLDQSHS